jgi:phosphatidylglycerophosphatase A
MRFIKRKEIINPDIKVNFFNQIVSSGLFTGYAPIASGTFGSLFAALFFFIPGFINLYILIPAIALFFLLGIFTSQQMVKRYGDDPSVVVIDEIVGMWITMLISGFFYNGLIVLVIGFFMFRFFDIVKLFPASYFDKLKNGFGIMLDDVIAGIYGGIATVLAIILINYFK